MFHKRELLYKNKFSYQYNILSFNKCHKKYEMRCALRFKILINASEILASSLNTKALFQWKGNAEKWEKESCMTTDEKDEKELAEQIEF